MAQQPAMDTIFALATAPGKAGVAILRISGPDALESLTALGLASPPPPRQAALRMLRIKGEPLDSALVLYFAAPSSFTGQEVIEYHLHGGRAVILKLLSHLATLPAFRPAGPGEFTRRAFLNGKIDLTAAEGLADLIDAETESQRRQALKFLQGEAAVFYGCMRTTLLEALALLEAYIDFPDEDIPASVLTGTLGKIESLKTMLASQLADKGAAERVRDGLKVAILGPPNAGKSSLLNWLSGRDAAIVSDVAGTTRDAIEVHLDIGGYAVTLTDTAGIRETHDVVESEGVRRSLMHAETADLRIVMLDAADPGWDDRLASLAEGGIVLINKTDLAAPPALPLPASARALAISLKTQAGLVDFMALLAGRVRALFPAQSTFIARSRHRRHLEEALRHLERYAVAEALELKCEELRRASVEIGAITGAIGVEEILGEIFSRFCIGK